MSISPLADEPTFEVNNFGIANTETGLRSLALKIHNLLLTEPGTYPNNYSLGINIAQYEFEIMDDFTLSDLSSNIMLQINRWIPDSNVTNVVVDRMSNYVTNDEKAKTSILVAVQLGEAIDNEKVIAIVLNKDRSTSKVVSEIITH
jgi:hypothetical protein